ncbi:pulmonary surfactant-associated protein D-like [Culex pipiens pallens]|uniref:pulmonary surfactant-associated protein D-like n=1 Tax=Culex pipiens pallens TaxID=42434 RepID=UPI001952F240|nr:pulmonary surfactant-associated protein D-like [Culex pipiens pallens]
MLAKLASLIFVVAFANANSSLEEPTLDEAVPYAAQAFSNDSWTFSVQCFPKRFIVFNHMEVSFFKAWHLCESYGFELATVKSPSEDVQLKMAIEEANPKQGGPWWIAGTDLGLEGHFVWLTTGKPIGYQTGYRNFGPGEPNNLNGTEHCVEVGHPNGTFWNDKNCDVKRRFICEAREPLPLGC